MYHRLWCSSLLFVFIIYLLFCSFWFIAGLSNDICVDGLRHFHLFHETVLKTYFYKNCTHSICYGLFTNTLLSNIFLDFGSRKSNESKDSPSFVTTLLRLMLFVKASSGGRLSLVSKCSVYVSPSWWLYRFNQRPH